jgi:hypothetical protein
MEKEIIDHSDNYGEVKYELIATIDFKKIFSEVSSDKYLEWMKDYHYTGFFASVKIKRLNLEEDRNFDSYEIYVPIDDINEDWNPEFWYNKYPSVRRTKKATLPIAISRKKVDLWKTKLSMIGY